jgi:hypothetical protein
VLTALGARHVVEGAFLLDSAFVSDATGIRYTLAPDADLRLDDAVGTFAVALGVMYGPRHEVRRGGFAAHRRHMFTPLGDQPVLGDPVLG